MEQRRRPPLLTVILTDAFGLTVSAMLPARLIGAWCAEMADDGWLTVVAGGPTPKIEVRL